MKKLLVVLFALSLVVGALPTFAQEPEEELPVFNFGVLESGVPFEDAFGVDSDLARLYAFSATADDTISLSMVSGETSFIDPYLFILSANGEVLASDDDSGEAALDAAISDVIIPEDGVYFVLATTFGALLGADGEERLEEQSFTLLLEGATPSVEFGEEGIDLDVRLLSAGDNPIIELADDVRFELFYFEGTADTTVNIVLQSDDFDALLYVFGPDGSRVGANDDSDNADDGALNSRVELEVAEDGNYLVIATRLSFDVLDELTNGEGIVSIE